jgi:hypothetical protein
MAKRQAVQKEWRLLSYWLAAFHPKAEIYMNVRIGPTLKIGGVPPADSIEEQASRLRNRWADAIFIENGDAWIVEAKVEPDPGIFSTLIHYLRKFRLDPYFSRYVYPQVHLVALVQRDDPSVAFEAPFFGVQWIVYHPPGTTNQDNLIRGGAVDELAPELPMDWPARLNLLTGR